MCNELGYSELQTVIGTQAKMKLKRYRMVWLVDTLPCFIHVLAQTWGDLIKQRLQVLIIYTLMS